MRKFNFAHVMVGISSLSSLPRVICAASLRSPYTPAEHVPGTARILALTAAPPRRHLSSHVSNSFVQRALAPTMATDSSAGGDIDSGGPGVLLRDLDFANLKQSHYYFLYENDRDDHPWKYTLVRVLASSRGNSGYQSHCLLTHTRDLSWPRAPRSSSPSAQPSRVESCAAIRRKT